MGHPVQLCVLWRVAQRLRVSKSCCGCGLGALPDYRQPWGPLCLLPSATRPHLLSVCVPAALLARDAQVARASSSAATQVQSLVVLGGGTQVHCGCLSSWSSLPGGHAESRLSWAGPPPQAHRALAVPALVLMEVSLNWPCSLSTGPGLTAAVGLLASQPVPLSGTELVGTNELSLEEGTGVASALGGHQRLLLCCSTICEELLLSSRVTLVDFQSAESGGFWQFHLALWLSVRERICVLFPLSLLYFLWMCTKGTPVTATVLGPDNITVHSVF